MPSYRDRLLPLIEQWTRAARRIAVFGVGPHTDLLFEELPELAGVNIVGYLDSDAGRHGSAYRGREIHAPAWATGHADVILCSSFVREPEMAAAAGSLGCTIVMSHGSALAPAPRGDVRAVAPLSLPKPVPGRADFVVLPIVDWSFRFQRPQQLATALAAAGHRVFYVRNVFQSGTRASTRPIADRLFEVTLPAPHVVNIYTGSVTPELLPGFTAALSGMAAEYGLADVVCLVDLPFWWPVARPLRETLGWTIVYDCMDHHAGFAGTSAAMCAEEPALIEGADLVAASSAPLLARVRERARRSVLLPNGADFEHFARSAGPPPAAVAGLPRPIVGYYGAVAEWFDSDLVGRLAAARPSWSFVIVGSTSGGGIAPLRAQPNVTMVPEQPYADLPPLLHAFDACVIPFRRTPLTDATNPVKLYEYWSAGKPVVATRLSELERFEPLLALAATDEQWLLALDDAVAERSAGEPRARREAAASNTWTVRAAALSDACAAVRRSRP